MGDVMRRGVSLGVRPRRVQREGERATHMTPIQLRNNNVPVNPCHSPKKPFAATTFLAQSIGPVYSLGPVVCIWSRALRCSVGQATKQTVCPARRPASCEKGGGSVSAAALDLMPYVHASSSARAQPRAPKVHAQTG